MMRRMEWTAGEYREMKPVTISVKLALVCRQHCCLLAQEFLKPVNKTYRKYALFALPSSSASATGTVEGIQAPLTRPDFDDAS